MRLPIRPLAATALVVVAVFLSGCFVIQSETTGQLDVIGDVEIATTACVNSSPGGATCPTGNAGSGSVSNYLIAYRIKDGVGAPDTITAASGDSVTFHADKTYSDSLTAVAPPPAGEHWVGYRSDPNPPAPTGTSTFKPHFTLPKSNGKPFQGPFTYRTVTGFMFDNSAGKDDPVVCANPPTSQGPTNSNGSQSYCIDSPSGTAYETDQDVPTRDLVVTSTGNGSVRQNESGELPFAAEFAGAADPSASFQISVSTDAPGVTLTPSTATFAPATDSTTAINVRADVAPTSPVGTYDVTLVASLPNGAERRATGKLTVALGKPLNLRLPVITGTAVVGKTVTCDNGDWSSSPTTFTYTWSREGAEIPGATAKTYPLTQADGATLVACTVTAVNEAGTGVATSGAPRVAQEGGADVALGGKPKVSRNSDGTYTVDTGITVSCPPRLPINCGGGNHVDASADTTTSGTRAAAARTIEVASAGLAAPTGKTQKVILRLTRRGSTLLDRRKSLSLVARVITRNHLLQRVTTTKRFTIRRPR